jgi:hypothetical protein
MGLKSSLVTIALTSAFAATAVAGPANATPAPSEDYAASVATTTTAIINVHDKSYTFGSYTKATSPSVAKLHGNLTFRLVKRVPGPNLEIYKATVAINGLSGKGYAINLSKTLFPVGGKYAFQATFNAKEHHLEKSSKGSKYFNR